MGKEGNSVAARRREYFIADPSDNAQAVTESLCSQAFDKLSAECGHSLEEYFAQCLEDRCQEGAKIVSSSGFLQSVCYH